MEGGHSPLVTTARSAAGRLAAERNGERHEEARGCTQQEKSLTRRFRRPSGGWLAGLGRFNFRFGRNTYAPISTSPRSPTEGILRSEHGLRDGRTTSGQ